MVDQGKTGAVGVLDITNHLIITDTAASIRRIEQIIAQIDKPAWRARRRFMSCDLPMPQISPRAEPGHDQRQQ